jgi:YD repeat-containing protein
VLLRSGNATYTYDPIGRLTSAKHPFEGSTTTYTLDDGGNVVHEGGPSGSATYAFAKNRLSRKAGQERDEVDGLKVDVAATARYAYDAMGDMTRSQGTATATAVDHDDAVPQNKSFVATTTYDAASHTLSVCQSDEPSLDYAYDASDRMVRRVEDPASGPDTVELMFHDGAAEAVVIETDASGDPQRRYVLDAAGLPIAQEKGSSASRAYPIMDPRDNVTQLLAQNEAVKAVYAYDPFGKDRPASRASQTRRIASDGEQVDAMTNEPGTSEDRPPLRWSQKLAGGSTVAWGMAGGATRLVWGTGYSRGTAIVIVGGGLMVLAVWILDRVVARRALP